ncbi:MAG TPA: AIM24 family protein [Mycobacteriales bacterium]|nr:AIM24 family protein [Mycobacteriales bacterium]
MPQSFIVEHAVPPATDPGPSLQNPFCLRYNLDGTMLARQGAMVAYRGDLTFRTKGQGARKLLKRAVTGEGLALMEVAGKGEIWLADLAKNVFVLPGSGLSISGKSVLCFDSTLQYEIKRVKGAGMDAGGLFNCAFSGDGSIAVTSDGQPIVLPVTPDAPVLVDTDAVIGWTELLETSIHRSQGVKSILKGGSGEMFQLQLQGEGYVIVQPSEGPLDSGKGGGVADTIGEILTG